MKLLYSQRTADGPRDSILAMPGAAVFTDGVRRRFLAIPFPAANAHEVRLWSVSPRVQQTNLQSPRCPFQGRKAERRWLLNYFPIATGESIFRQHYAATRE